MATFLSNFLYSCLQYTHIITKCLCLSVRPNLFLQNKASSKMLSIKSERQPQKKCNFLKFIISLRGGSCDYSPQEPQHVAMPLRTKDKLFNGPVGGWTYLLSGANKLRESHSNKYPVPWETCQLVNASCVCSRQCLFTPSATNNSVNTVK
jgi:hypothetical protein